MGSAHVQGDLWGARMRDWADVQEPLGGPLFEAVLSSTKIAEGTQVLDAGCGTGIFLAMASAHGAKCAGVDASAWSIQWARQRVPEAELHIGDVEGLPFEDGRFDVVVGNDSFQFAESPKNALREAHRVLRAGGLISIATWATEDKCQAKPLFEALHALLPSSPRAAGPFALSAPGAVEAQLKEAGFSAVESQEVVCRWEYRDEETMLRGVLSAGPAVAAIRNTDEARVREAAIVALAPFEKPDGAYVLDNTFRYVVARR